MKTYYCHKEFSKGLTCIYCSNDGVCTNTILGFKNCEYAKSYPNPNVFKQNEAEFTKYVSKQPSEKLMIDDSMVYDKIKYILVSYIKDLNLEAKQMNTSIICNPGSYFDARAKIEVLITLLKQLNFDVKYELNKSKSYPYIVNMHIDGKCIYTYVGV